MEYFGRQNNMSAGEGVAQPLVMLCNEVKARYTTGPDGLK